MSKRIAIITGATGGIGREFTRLLVEEDIDEVWTVARNEKKLQELKKLYGEKVIPLAKDFAVLIIKPSSSCSCSTSPIKPKVSL